MTDSNTIRNAVETVALRNLGPGTFERVTIREELDQAGEDALFIDISMKPAHVHLTSEQSVRMRLDVSTALLASGEGRIPYLTFSYPDDVPAADDLRETESKYSTRRAS